MCSAGPWPSPGHVAHTSEAAAFALRPVAWLRPSCGPVSPVPSSFPAHALPREPLPRGQRGRETRRSEDTCSGKRGGVSRSTGSPDTWLALQPLRTPSSPRTLVSEGRLFALSFPLFGLCSGSNTSVGGDRDICRIVGVLR